MDASIIIVNFNSTSYLLSCLASIFKETRDIEFEVIVVDNASTDNGCDLIRRQYPGIRIIESSLNLGFAGANNIGFDQASGSYVLFLNPDTVILENAITICIRHLDKLPDAGALGCRLLNSDLSVQTSAILPIPTIFNQIFSFEFLRTKFHRFSFFGTKQLYERQKSPVKVSALSGAGLFVRREAFIKAGMFDTSYFMYSEDVDLCYSIGKQGYGIYYANDASIVHHGGTSTKNSPIKQFSVKTMKTANYTFLKKWRGKPYADLYKTAFAVASCMRLIVLAIALPFSFANGRTKKVAWSIQKWFTILLWALSPIHRVKQ